MIEKHGDSEIKIDRDESGELVMQLPGKSEWEEYDGRFGSFNQHSFENGPKILPLDS